MKIAFPRESVITLNLIETKDLPETQKVKATIKWPTTNEEGDIPDLIFEDIPVSEEVAPAPAEDTPAPAEDTPAPKRRATKKSLHAFADAVLRNQVPKIENLEGATSGAALADLPEDAAPEVLWAIIVAYRAGPNAVIEKKKD